ncbi:MFS transporter [Prolixibacter sp. NT017]|nr:MFS transporter [Prolixibacter sp. NT017]
MIGTFMAVLDATIVNVGLPKIMASFGVSIDKIEWVLTAYMLAMAVMLPTSGWFADRFGHKRMYFFGLFLFTFGSMMCGMSGNEDMLIFSRVIQGLGAGSLMPIGMAIITREFPPEQRGTALGFWAISAAASVSFGPLIGGYLVDNFSWKLMFDVNVPVGIIGMVVTMIIQQEYVNHRVGKFDLIGFLSVSIFLPVLLYALSEGNAATNSEGWHAPFILISFAISAIAFTIFIITELTVDKPLVDLKLLKNYNFAISNLIMFIFGIGMFGSTFLLPLFLQNSLGYTAIQAGAVFLPIGFIQGAASPIAGSFADKYNAKIPVVLGIILLALSFYLNSLFSRLTEHNYIMTSLYIRGLAMGIIFTPLSAISLLEIPRHQMAQASGLFNVIRQLGGSFGVAILATLLSSRIKFHTTIYGGALNANSETFKQVTHGLTNYIQHTTGSSLGTAAMQAKSVLIGHVSSEAFVQGIDDDFLIAAIITLIGGIPVFWLHTRKKLEAKNRVNHD